MDPTGSEETSRLADDKSPNSVDKTNITSLLIGFGFPLFFGLILLLVLNYFNVLSLSKIFPNQLGWLPTMGSKSVSRQVKVDTLPTQSPLNPGVIDVEILEFSKEVLKPEYVFVLELPTLVEKRDEPTQSITFTNGNGVSVNNVTFIPVYFQNYSRVFSGVRIDHAEIGQPAGDLEAVLNIFNKYYNMPNVDKSEWKTTQIPTINRTKYELIINETDEYFETRTAFTAKNKTEEKYLVYVMACKITKENSLFTKKSCLQ